MGLGLRIASAKHAGLAFAGLLLFASPAYAACTTTDLSPLNTSVGATVNGDEAYIVDPSLTGLDFDSTATSAPGDRVAITNGVAIDTTGNSTAGIAISGDFATICYDGQASGSIVADGAGLFVEAFSDGEVLLTVAHTITAGMTGVAVWHTGNGSVTIAADDITAPDGGITVVHTGAGGDISITTSSGSTISAHGGLNGPLVYALGQNIPVGIYVDRSNATTDTTVSVENGADISADGVGIYVDVCSCGGAVTTTNVQSTGTIDVVDGAGIYVSQGGQGNTTVAQSGKVTVLDGLGVVVDQYGDGDVSASATGGVEATDVGLRVSHFAGGNVTVTAGGTYDISKGSGIEVSRLGDGAIGIVSTATINSEFDAIGVEHLGNGNVTVDQTGKLTVVDGAGVWIDKFGDGDVGVAVAGDIEATDGGIAITHEGETGMVTVTTSAGSTISAHGGLGPGFNGPTGIYVDRYFAGPGTGSGGISITNGADIETEALGIFAALCGCAPGDLTIASTGAIDVDGFLGTGILAMHDGEGVASVNASGPITVASGIGIFVQKSGAGTIDITTRDVSASFGAITATSLDGADINIAANGTITATNGFGILAGVLGASDVDIASTADIVALDAAIMVSHLGTAGDVDIRTSGGKLSASGGMMFYAGGPPAGSAGIYVSLSGSGGATITSGSAIEVDGVGIYVGTCGCMDTAVAIVSSADITAPYGIVASATGALSLNQSAGTIGGTQGVTLTGSTIAATIAAGAEVAVNGAGPGRYGMSLTGASDVTIAGTIDAPGADALLLTGGDARVTLLPGFLINGQVDALDAATNELIFGGATGTESFDLDRLGTSFTDFDSFLKTGNSTWTFSGASFTGLLTARAGTVVVNSAIPGLDLVVENATFRGNAGIGSLTTSGGTLSPGNSIGTVTVAGNIAIGANTVYEVEVNAAGDSDKLVAGGTAAIDATASVLASMEPGSFGAVTQYAIVTAAGGVTGAFSGVNSVSAFYDAQLTYDFNNAYLTLTRNALTLGDFAQTPNQIATAAALDGGGQSVPYFDDLFVLPAGEVPGALDAISGDGYASLTAAALDNGRFLRDAALDRQGARGIWTTPYGGLSHLPGDGNGPGVDHATGGLLLGADGVAGDGYLGVLLGYGQTSYAVPSRDMTASSGEFSLGSYGGLDWDGFYASFGGTITARDIDATRRVVFPGVSDTFTAQYASLTAQAFTELGFRLEMGSTTVIPFGGLAGLHSHTTGYTEAGTGAGALTVDPGTAAALVATLGVRVEHEIALNDDATLTLRGSAAWRHAMGKASTTNSLAGTDPFTVAGTPLAGDTLTISAGTELDMGQLDLGLDYTGSFGSGGMANAARATLAGQF